MDKIVNLGDVNVHYDKYKVVGFVLKRAATTEECRYIMSSIFDIVLDNAEDYDNIEEFKEYNKDVTDIVNSWLVGEVDDSFISDYADTYFFSLRIIDFIPLIIYLKKCDII